MTEEHSTIVHLEKEEEEKEEEEEEFFTINPDSKIDVLEKTVHLETFIVENKPRELKIDRTEHNLNVVMPISDAIVFLCVLITRSNHPNYIDQRKAIINKYCSNGTTFKNIFFVNSRDDLYYRCLNIMANI
jgi:hypothetical protein